MREFYKGVAILVILAAMFATAFAWVAERPDQQTWLFRVGSPIAAVAAFVVFLLIHFRRDIVPDYLRQQFGGYLDRGGFCFTFAPTVEEDIFFLEVYFQNRYEEPCVGRIGLRPAKGLFRRSKIDAITYEIQLSPAAFGFARVAVPIPLAMQGKRQKFEVGASVDYPQGQGRMLRFRDGQVLRTNSNFGNTFGTALAIAGALGDRTGEARNRHDRFARWGHRGTLRTSTVRNQNSVEVGSTAARRSARRRADRMISTLMPPFGALVPFIRRIPRADARGYCIAALRASVQHGAFRRMFEMRSLLAPTAAAMTVLSVCQIARAQDEELVPGEGDAVVVEILRSVLKKHDVPAMAGAIVTSEGVRVIGVAGVRKRGTEIPVTLKDTWHLGSDTKAMTATMIAGLVEQERMVWDTTIGEVFPRLRSRIDAGFREVTLLQLLSHRSGLAGDISLVPYRGKNGTRARLAVVMRELGDPPKHKPGSKHEYANMGFIVAGAMVEKATGKSWQKNMEQHVFKPLEMKSVGYGGTGTPGKIDQPWGHTEEGTPDARNGPAMDNPPVMGPAGRVHCSMADWARFIVDLLRGLKGEQALLEGASYKKLTTPPFGGDYALGWSAGKRGWGGGTVLNHGGSNTMNYANVWVAPKRDFAILVCVNQGGDAGFRATDAAVGALIEHQNSGPGPKSR